MIRYLLESSDNPRMYKGGRLDKADMYSMSTLVL